MGGTSSLDPLTGLFGSGIQRLVLYLEGHRRRCGLSLTLPIGGISCLDPRTTIRIWDAETGALVGDPLEGHTGGVNPVAYSPDGQRIISGSDDNTI